MIQNIIDLLYPRRCPFCDEIVDWGRMVCPACEERLVFISEPVCKRCGKPLEEETAECCFDCMRKEHAYRAGTALFVHQGAVRDSVYRFKYKNKREYAYFYARQTAKRRGEWIRRRGIEAIVPIPLHKNRQKERGYNQAELYARFLGRLMGIPVVNHCLVRSVDTRPQKELDDVQRKNNLKKAFKCKKNIVQFRYILLVDDIYTTGSTVDAAAMVLKQAGVQEVFFACISIGMGF